MVQNKVDTKFGAQEKSLKLKMTVDFLSVQDNLDADISEVEEDLYDDDVISNESVCSEEGRQQPEDTIIATSPATSVENQFKELQEIK